MQRSVGGLRNETRASTCRRSARRSAGMRLTQRDEAAVVVAEAGVLAFQQPVDLVDCVPSVVAVRAAVLRAARTPDRHEETPYPARSAGSGRPGGSYAHARRRRVRVRLAEFVPCGQVVVAFDVVDRIERLTGPRVTDAGQSRMHTVNSSPFWMKPEGPPSQSPLIGHHGRNR